MKHKEMDKETLYMIRKCSANIFTDVVASHLGFKFNDCYANPLIHWCFIKRLFKKKKNLWVTKAAAKDNQCKCLMTVLWLCWLCLRSQQGHVSNRVWKQSFQATTHSEIQKYFLKSDLFPDNSSSGLCS